MPSYATLLGGLSTVVVGGSIAAGVGYAMMPEKKSNVQQTATTNESIFVPPNFSHTTNYLVSAVSLLPSEKQTNATCSLNVDCQLFSKRTKAIITNKQTHLIQTNDIYIFNTSLDTLNHEDVVSLNIGTGKNLFLLVVSKPAKDKSISITPTQPQNLINKQAILQTYKNVDSLQTNADVLRSKHFYNMLEDTYVDRKDIKHDSYIIFEWESSTTDQINNPQLSRIEAIIDPYIFKSFDDQKLEQIDNPELITTINQAEPKTLIEIYEIQQEDTIKDVMNSLKIKNTTVGVPNWEVLAQENLMLTKPSQLQKGKYYKFVFSNFEAIEKEINRGLNNFQIELKYSDSFTHKLLSKARINNNYFCAKFSANSGFQNKCEQFKNPGPRPRPSD